MTLIGEPPAAAERWEAPRGIGHEVNSYLPAPWKKTVQSGRPGGRRPEETRPCNLRVGAVPNAVGSAYLEQGCTKIIASVYGPRQIAERMHQQSKAEGVLFVDIQFAPFSTRECSREDNEKRAVLYSSILQSTLESVVLLDRYAKTMFDVTVLVLEDDGAVLTSSLAAASLALAHAKVEMKDLVAGATVHLSPARGIGDARGTICLDCTREEERALPDGSAVLHLGICPSRGLLCLLHSAGPLPAQAFEQMTLLAKETAETVGAAMRSCLERRVEHRIAKRARLAGYQLGNADADINSPITAETIVEAADDPVAEDAYMYVARDFDDGYG
eukprot:TRINITY_DN6677_c0_g1_i1.p1 TRINITY_DN6677_c0_g1~~TRINITY_DN6677_c0_g1_i1.p1  ORF type:complete len:330 (-),score=49.56 TRINITY_DN6677_c0_g1_i1:129-1118(-)